LARVIVITGAGSGLGLALARRFARDGDEVVLLGRTLAKLEGAATAIGVRAAAIACDVASPDSVRAAFATIAARFPKIDVLINNAAVVEHFDVAEATDEEILADVGTNLIGPILCARAAIPLINRGGHILNVSSGAADMAFPGLAVYGASKAGLERFSLSLRRELEAQNINATFVRCGQMIEAGATWDNDPEIARRAAIAASHGIDPRKRASSTFDSVTDVFRTLIDLPADFAAAGVTVRPRAG